MKKSQVVVAISLVLTTFGQAGGDIEKIVQAPVVKVDRQALKSNYQVIYNDLPQSVDSFSDMFTQGKYYGRLRSNNFYFKWKDEDSKHTTHSVSGLGASVVYKSATFNNFDFTVGGYFTRAFFKKNNDPVAHFKPGKGTLSRYDYLENGNDYMAVLGQAYLRYSGIDNTEVKVGRQLVETFYTKSNDTKMIPNTFDGIYLSNKSIDKTVINLAYLKDQKLRDHTDSHGVLVFGGSGTSKYSNFTGNDDTAMHRYLTYDKLAALDLEDQPLIVGDIHNTSIENLKIDASFYVVPDLLSQYMGELNYKFTLANGITVTPGIRYVNQVDNGAGAIGGASYYGSAANYKDPDSLDGQMFAARVVTKIDNYKINLGYSKVFDEADLITPWRSFVTSGYTRSMARYNWRANTQSYRIEVQRNANLTGIYNDMYIQASILYTDADESKDIVGETRAHRLDEIYYYAGFVQNIKSLDNLQWRLRLGYTDYVHEEDSKFDNLDGRFELNYLF